MKRVVVAFACVAGSAWAGRPPNGATAPIDRPAAFVFREPIWQSELDDALALAPVDGDAVLDRLIDETIALRAARERGINVDDAELDRAIDEVKKTNNLDQAELEKALAAQHYTLAEYRIALRRGLIMQHFYYQELSPKLPPGGTPDERFKKLEAAEHDWLAAQRAHAHIDKLPAAAPGKVAWNALANPVTALDVRFADKAIAVQAKTALADQLKKPLDRARLRGVLATLLALPGVADVHVSGTQTAAGITLVVELVAQPTIRAIALRDETGADMTVPPELAVLVTKVLDPHELDRAAAAIRDRYIEHGHVDVTADWKTTPATTGRVDVAIQVTPGPRYTIDKVEFHGADHAKRDELLAVVAADVPRGGPYQADHVERAILLLQAYYFDHGYLNVRVDSPPPVAAAKTLVFDVKEGDQFRFGELAITGLPPDDTKRELAKIGKKLARGAIAARSAIVEEMEVLKQDTSAKEIVPLTEIDAVKKTIKMTLEVHR